MDRLTAEERSRLGSLTARVDCDRIRLRHCPFLELAEPHRDLVCPVHLGLMQGALAELRAPVTVSALIPFAETTACLAHLAPAPDHEVSPS